jgi:hypothetical protein
MVLHATNGSSAALSAVVTKHREVSRSDRIPVTIHLSPSQSWTQQASPNAHVVDVQGTEFAANVEKWVVEPVVVVMVSTLDRVVQKGASKP